MPEASGYLALAQTDPALVVGETAAGGRSAAAVALTGARHDRVPGSPAAYAVPARSPVRPDR